MAARLRRSRNLRFRPRIGAIGAPARPCRTLSMRKVLSGLVPLAAALVAAWLISLDRQGRLVWDHWDEVKRGVLYRSGQLAPEPALRGDQAIQHPHGHQLAVAGRGDDGRTRTWPAGSGSTSSTCRCPATGWARSGSSARSSRSSTTPIDGRPWSIAPGGPAGPAPRWPSIASNATGGRPRTWRRSCERQTYHYGLVPGYIYAMVKTKPSTTLLRSEMLVDRNRATEMPRKEAVDGQ